MNTFCFFPLVSQDLTTSLDFEHDFPETSWTNADSRLEFVTSSVNISRLKTTKRH